MKLSKLIEELTKARNEIGNVEVRACLMEQENESLGDTAIVEGFVTMMNDVDEPSYLLICDEAHLDMFASGD